MSATTWIPSSELSEMTPGHQYAFTYSMPIPYNDAIRHGIDNTIFAMDAIRPDIRVLRVIHNRPDASLANGKKSIPWTVRIELLKLDNPKGPVEEVTTSVKQASASVKAALQKVAGAGASVIAQAFEKAEKAAGSIVADLRLVLFMAAAVLIVIAAKSARR